MASHSTELSFINSKFPRKLKKIIIWKFFSWNIAVGFELKQFFFIWGMSANLSSDKCSLAASQDESQKTNHLQCTCTDDHQEIAEALWNAWVKAKGVISKGNLQVGICYWPSNQGSNTN